jgi:hypothetical protein
MAMTTKPKTRKAPPKRATPKAATKQASGSGICGLIARWHFLEAEVNYLAAISPGEKSDAAVCKHQREQDEIEIKLSRSIPQDLGTCAKLLKFAADMIGEGDRPDHGGQMMMRNGLESLPEIFSGEREAARIAGLEEMRRTIAYMTEGALKVIAPTRRPA